MFGIHVVKQLACLQVKSNRKIPSFDWDLCDIWHATSRDRWNWVEDPVPAVTKLEKSNYSCRSISTTDILIGKISTTFIIRFNEIPGLHSETEPPLLLQSRILHLVMETVKQGCC